jgi:propanol-preferring alcohol dehydrogenase
VGTRHDLDEALAFAAEGKISAEITKAPLENTNDIFDRMKSGGMAGMVLDFG